MSHSTVVFVKHSPKQFSVTARQESNAHLAGVIANMEAQGFQSIVLATSLKKQDAEFLKKTIFINYVALGYESVSRLPLGYSTPESRTASLFLS